MKLAVSNIALPSFNHFDAIGQLADSGISGLEVAPSKVWENTDHIAFSQVQRYRQTAERYGLSIIGIHSLFYDHPELGLFGDLENRKRTVAFIVHLSKISRDLGGTFLVFGSPQARRRGRLSINEADNRATDFFSRVCSEIEPHGTFILLEALGKNESDYIHSLEHVGRIIDRVGSRVMAFHFDVKAALEAKEVNIITFNSIKQRLKHVHVNEPDLGILVDSANHNEISRLMRGVNYGGYVSLEQRMVDPSDILSPIQKSVGILRKYYAD